MPHPLVEKAKAELEHAQSQLEQALHAWDTSVSELWRTSLALTQAQKRLAHAHELLREAVETAVESLNTVVNDSRRRLTRVRRLQGSCAAQPICVASPESVLSYWPTTSLGSWA